MRVLVTGSRGFIGKNLVVRLGELTNFEVVTFEREDDVAKLPTIISSVDSVVHLAGENRPKDESDYFKVNARLTERLCEAIMASGRNVPLILASSTHAELDNSYGLSKLAAEEAVKRLSAKNGNSAVIFRLSGVFGKWCKPNYNSVVATFCHNISRNIPININDCEVNLQLVYVDDVVSALIASLLKPSPGVTQAEVVPKYSITLGDLADQIRKFSDCRRSLMTERVGAGLVRALYATYVSYLPTESFGYEVTQHSDSRGVFVEMLKTPDCGQYSFFTAYPGVTRGGHYHHTKTEKFLVIKGQALFRFRHLLTKELYELRTSGDKPQVVDTIPGWSHDITNIGNDELIVMLWANEVFDRQRPDTFSSKV